MSIRIVVPELGESVLEATVGHWLKHEGDAVNAGEVLVSLETDKVDLEVGAERSGVLSKIERREGDDVKIGDVLGEIDESGRAQSGPKLTPAEREALLQAPVVSAERIVHPAKPDQSAGAEADGGQAVKRQPAERQAAGSIATEARPAVESTGPSAGESGSQEQSDDAAATPSARRLARERGVDLGKVSPRNGGGRVTKSDVERHLAQAAPAAGPGSSPERPVAASAQRPVAAAAAITNRPARSQPEVSGEARGEERIRMSRRRQTIARRLVEAQHAAAMLTTFNEADMSAVMELRKRYKESFQEKHGVGLGISSFFVKACVAALKDFPRLNSEIDGDDIILKHYYDIGIAVGASEGLVVPVLRDADRLSFAAIERGIKDFARKAQDRTLSLDDLRGGTFSITNGGVFGSLMSTPILNPPQVGILGLHKIQQRPVSIGGQVGGQIVSRPMMYLALSYDHRVVDGLEAVQFLVRVKELVEEPASLLLEG
jgi:2-oxoglutarate dehydrogenase E2 component (dihydrolipoamide succinyltransferase)